MILSGFCNFSDILGSLEQKSQKNLNLLKTDKIYENCKVYHFGFLPTRKVMTKLVKSDDVWVKSDDVLMIFRFKKMTDHQIPYIDGDDDFDDVF